MNPLRLLYSIICLVLLVAIKAAFSTITLLEFRDWVTDPINVPKIEMPSLPQYVIITDTKLGYCYSTRSCSILLNDLLNYETNGNTLNTFSHFYIGGDGLVYIARGWDSFAENNPISCDSKEPYINITFIAEVGYSDLPTNQIRTAQKLLESGLINGKLSESYKLFGEWQLNDKTIRWSEKNKEFIETWPHWTAKIENSCI